MFLYPNSGTVPEFGYTGVPKFGNVPEFWTCPNCNNSNRSILIIHVEVIASNLIRILFWENVKFADYNNFYKFVIVSLGQYCSKFDCLVLKYYVVAHINCSFYAYRWCDNLEMTEYC